MPPTDGVPAPFRDLAGLAGSRLQRRAVELAHQAGNDSLAELLKSRAMSDAEIWDEIRWRYGTGDSEDRTAD